MAGRAIRGTALLLVLGVVAWVPPAAEGGRAIYRWQAADGTVHFGDLPPVADARRLRPGRAASMTDACLPGVSRRRPEGACRALAACRPVAGAETAQEQAGCARAATRRPGAE